MKKRKKKEYHFSDDNDSDLLDEMFDDLSMGNDPYKQSNIFNKLTKGLNFGDESEDEKETSRTSHINLEKTNFPLFNADLDKFIKSFPKEFYNMPNTGYNQHIVFSPKQIYELMIEYGSKLDIYAGISATMSTKKCLRVRIFSKGATKQTPSHMLELIGLYNYDDLENYHADLTCNLINRTKMNIIEDGIHRFQVNFFGYSSAQMGKFMDKLEIMEAEDFKVFTKKYILNYEGLDSAIRDIILEEFSE